VVRVQLETLRHLAALARGGRPEGEPGPWYEIRAAASSDEATILLYDEISWFWGITADDFARAVAGLDVSRINLLLNSPGGDVFDGIAIYNILRTHQAEVHVRVDGLAASIASVIAMAGDRIVMGPGTQMMIHNPHGIAMGEAADMRDYAELLDRTAGEIAGFYRRQAGGTDADWLAAMNGPNGKGTWYTGAEAVAAGLAHEADGSAASDPAPEDLRNVREALLAGWQLSSLRVAASATATARRSTEQRSAELVARHRARMQGGK
jgi:ATP-dependent protease ClpP protease subunit